MCVGGAFTVGWVSKTDCNVWLRIALLGLETVNSTQQIQSMRMHCFLSWCNTHCNFWFIFNSYFSADSFLLEHNFPPDREVPSDASCVHHGFVFMLFFVYVSGCTSCASLHHRMVTRSALYPDCEEVFWWSVEFPESPASNREGKPN